MEKGKTKKKLGALVMILGVIFMVVSYLKTNNVDIVLIGLVIVIVGHTVYFLGQKEAAKE